MWRAGDGFSGSCGLVSFRISPSGFPPTEKVKTAAPSNARSAAIATGRSEGDMVIGGVGGDSGESEGRTVRLEDGNVAR